MKTILFAIALANSIVIISEKNQSPKNNDEYPARIIEENGQYSVVDRNGRINDYGTNRTEAVKDLRFAKYYGYTKYKKRDGFLQLQLQLAIRQAGEMCAKRKEELERRKRYYEYLNAPQYIDEPPSRIEKQNKEIIFMLTELLNATR